MSHAQGERRRALSACAVVALAAATALSGGTAWARGYTRSVRIVPRCGYSKALNKEYACRVVTVHGPGYTRVDWFSVGLGVHTYPWERLVWQYRWQATSTRPTACRIGADGLPNSPTYRRSRWVTAERLTIYEAAHTATTRGGATVRVAARVRRLPWGHKQLTIRKVSIGSCSAPALGVQAALAGGASLPPLSRLTVVADQGVIGSRIDLDVVGARAGAHTSAGGATGVRWDAPETVVASPAAGAAGSVATALGGGLPAAPGGRVGATTAISLPLRAGTWTLAVKGSASYAPRATVSVVAAAAASVPVTPGQGVLLAAAAGSGMAIALQLPAPQGIGAIAAAKVSVRPVAGRGRASLSVAPLAVSAGASAATLSIQGAAAAGAYRLQAVTVTWTGVGGAQASQSFELEVVGVGSKR